MQLLEGAALLSLQLLWEMHLQVGPSLHVDPDMHWPLQSKTILSFLLLHDHRSLPVLVLNRKSNLPAECQLQFIRAVRARNLHPLGNNLRLCWNGRLDDRRSLLWAHPLRLH